MKSLAERVYAAVLWCYPPGFRRAHGLEMRQFARTALGPGRGRGVLWMLAADTVRGLLREWTATLRGEHMRNLARDVQHGARLLLRSPAFTAAAVITLALGIGANTAMFTLADATLLRPLKVRDAERMVVWSWTSSYPDYQEYTKRTDVFDGVAAVAGGGRLSFAIDGNAELAQSVFVSGNAFDVFGVRAAHGRTILPSDDVANGPLIAVLGYDYWRSRFGGDPAIVGRTFRVNGRPIAIVGVLENGFRGTSLSANPAFYLPTGVYNQVQTGFFSRMNALTTRGFVWLNVIGRLRPGVTATEAAATMTGVYAQLHPPKPGEKTEQLVLETLPTRSLGRNAASVKNFVMLLLGVVALTLLIGCANLANLLLAKAATRRREIGVRLALGATRGRVVRQMLAESMLLAGVGGIAGIGVAALALQALSKYQLPGGIAIENMRLEIHGVALAATLGLSVLTGLLFGAFPAWRASRTDVLVSLRDESRGFTARSGIRSALLGAQIALSLVLLAGTGLFARSLMSGLRTPLGFDERDVITASVNLGFARYDEARAEGFFAAALERVRALPQIESAAWGNLVPTRGVMLSQTEIEGYSPQAGETPTIYGAHVGPGYFHTIGTRLLTGREIAGDDRPASPAVAVINDAMARKYWSGRNPIGGRFLMFKQWITVVGVVENTVVRELGEKPVPHMYLAFNQWISGPQGIAMDPAHLFVRSRVGTASAMPLVRDQLRALDPELPLYDIEPFEDRVRALVMPQRMGVVLFALFSTLAVALATVGIYGVSTYVAALRTREIGVRIALGASSTAVRRLILLDGAKPVALGIAVGLAIALFASRLARAFLLDISPFDPLTFTGVTLLLAAVALTASYVPARRASRIEPVAALRKE